MATWITKHAGEKVAASHINDLQTGKADIEYVDKVRNLLFGSVYDDFDRTDRALNGDVSASGQTWVVSGTGAATCAISDGRMVATANCYAFLPAGATIARMEGVFSFVPGAGEDKFDQDQLTIIASHAQDVDTMIHLTINPTLLGLTIRRAGEAAPWPNLFAHKQSLRCDGTKYHIAISISGDVVTVETPEGKIITGTHADVSTINPQYGCWQIDGEVDGFTGRWHACSIGEKALDSAAVLGGAAPEGEIAMLKGELGSRRQKIEFTTPATIGWYRIALQDVYVGYSMCGEVLISAYDSALQQVWRLGVNGVPTLAPGLANLFAGQYGVIDQARLSTDSGTGDMALDIHLSAARAATIIVEFTGVFTMYYDPATAGATALTTASATLNFPTNPPMVVNFSLPATVGWYRIATHASWVYNTIMGTVIITASDVARVQRWVIHARAAHGDTDCFLTSLEGNSINRIFDQARLSVDTSTYVVGLDLHLENADGCAVTIEFQGAFTPVPAPVVGASAYSSGVATLVFAGGAVAGGNLATLNNLRVNTTLDVGGAYKFEGVQVLGAQAAAQADLKADYTTSDLDTEAEIITAINTTNAGFNTLLAKLRTHGTIDT